MTLKDEFQIVRNIKIIESKTELLILRHLLDPQKQPSDIFKILNGKYSLQRIRQIATNIYKKIFIDTNFAILDASSTKDKQSHKKAYYNRTRLFSVNEIFLNATEERLNTLNAKLK